MIITINGEKKDIAKPLDLQRLLQHEGYSEMTIAVARNGVFVQKDNYDSTQIEDGDAIEIVAPMQGG